MWTFGGLPYTVKSGSHYHSAGSVTYAHDTNFNDWCSPTPYSGGGDEFYFHKNDGTATAITQADVYNTITSHGYLIIGFWYVTDS